MKNTFDYIIIGQGLAGLATTYYASKNGSVALVSKNNIKISNSYAAQGGVAASISKNDSVLQHYIDTINAGKGLCNPRAVKILVKEGKNIIEEIIQLGMKFDSTDSVIDVSLEGGHSISRVLHASGTATGKELVNFFSGIISKNKNIKIFNYSFLYEILKHRDTVQGATIFNIKTKKVKHLKSNKVILATGGLAGLFQRSTNPKATSGDGIILAYNTGVEIENIELIQFHPTALSINGKPPFLLSEALRGDGALLVDRDGKQIFYNSKINELSPRDEVTKGIFNYLAKENKKKVFLNLSRIAPEILKEKYSPILKELRKNGFSIAKKLIPIAPAAHYSIGGIKTGLYGQTNIKGLYAIGEAASTGVHGANRLASNSLLECLVFAKRCIIHSNKLSFNSYRDLHFKEIQVSANPQNLKNYLKVRKQIGELLWHYAGIMRNNNSLELCLNKLSRLNMKYEIDQNDLYIQQIRNVIQLATLITTGALARKESRGCHWRSDFPNPKKAFKRNIIQIKRDV